MAGIRWIHSNTTVYNLGYHFIWCPKYRRKVLVGDIEKRLRVLLVEKACKIGVSIIEMEIMPDHLHLFVQAFSHCKPTLDSSTAKGLHIARTTKGVPRVEDQASLTLESKLLR